MARLRAQETPVPTPPVLPLTPPPAVRREMRAVWIATVNNMDWPSRKNMTTAQQKAEMIDLLNRAQALHMNAVFFQVRPAADALYQSKLEPWSEFLTGQMGKAPKPFFDPLAFAVEEAHRRGLELHAWFNPYRARMSDAKTPASADHISRAQPGLVKKYGSFLWMDPGDKQVQDHTSAVILDVVKRYDIDGVHFDDYFYPYKEKDSKKRDIPFPDDASWADYVHSGGKLTKADWRRHNVNVLVSRLSREIKTAKPWVQFGISPFGIWRPGYPAQIKGLDAYNELYADARTWLKEGWIDYLVPQLYWKIETPAQSFPVLLNWWTHQNPLDRHIWAGLYTDKAVSGKVRWPKEEIEYQVRVTRGQDGATGAVHFGAQSLLKKDVGGLTKRLANTVYGDEALPPTSPWIPARPVTAPIAVVVSPEGVVSWIAGDKAPVWKWVIQRRNGDTWKTVILPGGQMNFRLLARSTEVVDEVVVSAVDRLDNQSPLVEADLTTRVSTNAKPQFAAGISPRRAPGS